MSQQSFPTQEYEPFKCDQCEYTISGADRLERHKKLHSTSFAQNLSCSDCGYIATQANQMLRHKNMHKKEKSYKCNDCDFASYDPFAVKKHSKTHYERERKIECSQCDRMFFKTSHMRRHELIHNK